MRARYSWHWTATLAMAVSLLATSCAPASPTGTLRESGAGTQSAQPKRVVIAIRGNAMSLAQEKTHPSGGGGSVPGIDGLLSLVHAGLVQVDPQDVVVAQL